MATKHAVSSDEVAQEESYSPLSLNKTLCISPPSGSKNQNEQRGGATPTSFGVGPPDAVVLKSTTDSMPRDASVADRYGPSTASSPGTPSVALVGEGQVNQTSGVTVDAVVTNFECSTDRVLPLCATTADGVSVAESSECDHRGDSERCITADRLQGTDMTVSVEETKCFSPVPVQPVAQMEGNEAPQPTDRGDEMEECRGATIDGCHSSHPSSASTHDSQSNPLKLVIAVHRNAESSSDVSATTSPTASTGPSINVFSNNLQISADNSRMRYSNRRRRPRPAMSQSFGSLFGPATPNVGSTVLRSPGSEFPLGTTVSTPGTPQIAGSSAAVSMYPTSPGVSGAVSTGGVSFYMEVFESLASICPDIPERLRIPMSRLRLTLDNQHELGKGQYGVVTQGELYPPGTDARSRTCTSPPPPASENLSARSNSSAALHAAGGSAHGRPLATSLSSGQISYDVDPAVTFAGLPLHQQPFSALTASFYNSGAELMSAQSSFCAFPHTPRANGSAVASTSAMMACTPTEEFALSAAIPRQQLTLDAAAVEAEEGPADEESPSPEDKSTRNARSVIDSAERTMSPHSPAWNPRFQLPRPSATVPQRCQRQGGELGSTSSCEIPNRSESWSSHKLPADEATIAAPLSQVPQPPSLCSCSLSASQCEPTPVFHADELQEEDLLVYGSDPGGHSRVFSNSCRSSEAPSPVHSPGGLHPRLRSGDHSPLPSLPISPRLLPTREVDALSVSIPLNEIGPTGQNRPHTALFHGDAVESQPTEGWGVIPSTHAADESERCNAAGTTALPSLPTASGSLSPPNSTIADDSGREAADSLRLAMLSAITDDHRTKNRCGAAERLRMAGNFPDLTSLTSSHRGTPFVGEVPLDMSESTAQGAGNGEQTDDDDGRRPNSREEAHMHECSVPYRHVAVKMYAKADLSSMKNSREGFCNEVLMASHLSHPCIAHVYGVSEDQEHIYLTIELADHGTLAEYIQKHGVFHAREMAPRLLADVVLALEYLRDSSAHPFVSAGEKTDEGGLAVNPLVLGGSEEAQLPSPAPELDGIVQHKDLKPQNLLLTWDYHVKLSDFGSACFLGDVKANRFGGSTAYLSPEVMLDSKAGPCSDLWALGCILCELMQGEPPFSGGNEYRLMEAIQSYAKGKTKLSLSDEIPAAAEDLIHQLLQPSPSDRLGSIERGGFGPLKQHPFFSAIDWDSVLEVNNVTSTNTDFTAELSEFLLEQEQAVLCAVVSLLPGRREIAIMGTPFETVPSEQPLLLVLTNAPRLMLLNPTASVSGEEGMAMLTFPWVPELRIEVLDRPDHVLISSTLEFGPLYLRDLSQSAAQWQAQLELVKSRSKDSKLGLVEALVGAQSMSFSSYSCVLTSMREAVSNSNVHPTPQLGTSSASNYLTSTGTMVSVPSARGVQRRTSGSSGEPRLFLRRMRGTTPVPFRSPSRASASARPGASPATSECSTPVRPTQCRSAPPEMTSPTPTVMRDASYDGETTKNPKTPAVHSPSGATASFAHGEFSSMLSAVQGSSTQIRGLMSPVEGGASLFSGFVLPQPVHSSGNDSSSVIPFSMDLGKPEDSSTAEGHSVDRVPSRAFGSAHEFS